MCLSFYSFHHVQINIKRIGHLCGLKTGLPVKCFDISLNFSPCVAKVSTQVKLKYITVNYPVPGHFFFEVVSR